MKIFVVIVCLIPMFSWACAAPMKGFGYVTHDDLIAKTNNIVLASFNGQNFVITEIIKSVDEGKVDFELIRFYRAVAKQHKRYQQNHHSNDFNKHKEPSFWLKKKARVSWFSGACTPSFTFKTSESYLLFLDSPANLYSAEIISSKNDRWYKYVQGKVKT